MTNSRSIDGDVRVPVSGRIINEVDEIVVSRRGDIQKRLGERHCGDPACDEDSDGRWKCTTYGLLDDRSGAIVQGTTTKIEVAAG